MSSPGRNAKPVIKRRVDELPSGLRDGKLSSASHCRVVSRRVPQPRLVSGLCVQQVHRQQKAGQQKGGEQIYWMGTEDGHRPSYYITHGCPEK
jgi:hypothetical protein